MENTDKPLRPGQVAAVAAGNALEFYDFVTYAFFAAQIGRSFFPAHSPTGSLLASLATFGAGFLFRPLGALVIGRIGDRRGRKPAMLLSFGLAGVAVAGLALTPPYRQVGLAAPVLAVGFRMLGGFALGGEVGPSTAFLLEAAPPLRRGLYVSFQAMSADAAVLAAGLVGVALSSLMDEAALDGWGWRIALLGGVVIVPFGLALRRTLHETLHRAEPAAAPPPSPGIARIAGLGVALLASATTVTYILDYLTTYAATVLGMPTRLAFGATVTVGLCSVVCDPFGGWLSDRFGRKPVLIVPACVLLLMVFPCFRLLDQFRSPFALLAATAVLAGASALSGVSMIVVVAESLPPGMRSAGLGLVYAGAISVFGGSAQFLVAGAVALTGNPLAPAWYMAGGVVVGLAAMLLLPETAPSRVAASTAAPTAGVPDPPDHLA